MTLATTADAPAAPVDRRSRDEAVSRERRGRERRRGGGRINKVAPRASRLQFLGAICTAVSLSGMTLLLLGTFLLHSSMPWAGVAVMGSMLGLSILTLIMGSIEQRLIEIRLELMMLNGGRRRSDSGPEARG